MGTYQERVEAIQADAVGQPGVHFDHYGSFYCGHAIARQAAAVIASDADARIAELEAECARLRGAMEQSAECDCEDKYSRNHCGACASCIARAALATPDAGGGEGEGTA